MASELKRTVVLVGLMGSGKSAVGKALALRLGVPFADGDRLVERRAGRAIAELFENPGEAAFRELEAAVTREALELPEHVFASGGGAFIDPRTRARIGERAVSVWLRARLDTLLKRCGDDPARPLLRKGSRNALERLMQSRYPVYAEADLSVDTDGLRIGQVATGILKRLRDRGALS